MKIPLSWLKEYIHIDASPEELSRMLTMIGLEVEGIEGAEQVFEIGLTPNLNHCSSVVGVARELSAVIEKPYTLPEGRVSENLGLSIYDAAKIKVEDSEKCPRYAARVIKNVNIAPSPSWMQHKLELCGIRPVNNVVDVTNYVLLELGHPLHAFDLDRLEEKEIVIRLAKEGESIKTLDGKERLLSSQILVIADKSRPVAVAGIMGGADTEVTDKTVNVLLESAYFHPGTIRRASKTLGLMTDASKKFERGTDPNLVITALERAAELILSIAGGQAVTGFIDQKLHDFCKKSIALRIQRINQLLGTHLGSGEVETIFRRLGFKADWKDAETLVVEVPTYRVDIHEEVDLIEEVARIYGYDNIPRETPRYSMTTHPHAPMYLFENETRDRLVAEGLQELLTCDLISPTQAEIVQDGAIAPDLVVKVLNPTSVEQSVLRPSLMPGLLQVVKYNLDHQNPNLSGFEVGRIHLFESGIYQEQSVAGIVLTGSKTPSHWDEKPVEVDFYDLKGILENIFKGFKLPLTQFCPSNLSIFHPGRQSAVMVGDLKVGSMGEVHPAVLRQMGIKERVYYAELNLHDLISLRKSDVRMALLPQFPASERDWTLTIHENVLVEEVFSAIRNLTSSLLEEVTLLYVYRSEKLGLDKKNVTFHFVYRDHNKTVSQQEVDSEHSRMTQEALKILGKAVI